MIRPLIALLRPQQWTKNLAALAGVIFGGRITQGDAILRDLLVVVVFIAASSATYIFNDLQDLDYDRQHPRKRLRPLAAGQVPAAVAGAVAAALAAGAVGVAAALNVKTLACVGAFLALNVLYSLRLKHVPLLDVTSIALGYVLRVLAGIYVLDDVPTAWITLCTFFLALFLAIGKRRTEFVQYQAQGSRYRPVLAAYDLETLDALFNSSATMTVVSYALFTATSGKNPSLIVTVPIVYYATMHYKRLGFARQQTGEPEQVLLKDLTIQVSVVLWLLCFIAIFYGEVTLFR